MLVLRWIALLMAGMLIYGCGILQMFFVAEGDAQPTPVVVEIPSEPPALYFLHSDIAFPMDRGSYCWTTDEAGLCVDVFPPSYTSEMHTLVIGNMLELLFDAPIPDSVSVSLHPGSDLLIQETDITAEAALDENGGVLVTVPENLNGNYVLMVFATWTSETIQHGDAFYTAPIRFGE